MHEDKGIDYQRMQQVVTCRKYVLSFLSGVLTLSYILTGADPQLLGSLACLQEEEGAHQVLTATPVIIMLSTSLATLSLTLARANSTYSEHHMKPLYIRWW